MKNAMAWAGTGLLVAGVAGSGCFVQLGGPTGGHETSGGPTSGGATTGTYGGQCPSASNDDACATCQKTSCCTELVACPVGTPCDDTFTAYSTCLYPDGTKASGYSSSYCETQVGAHGSPSGDLIECIAKSCATECNTPLTTTVTVTWDGFAADFMESYCNGCHFPGYVAPSGKMVPGEIPQFTDDSSWQSWGMPKGNTAWKMQTSYAETTGGAPNSATLSEMIWCGVSTNLDAKCGTDFPGHFMNAERFPPAGTDPTKAHCWWAADGMTCPQPTVDERNKMSFWLTSGTPK